MRPTIWHESVMLYTWVMSLINFYFLNDTKLICNISSLLWIVLLFNTDLQSPRPFISVFHTTVSLHPFSSLHTSSNPFPRTFSSTIYLSDTCWVFILTFHWLFRWFSRDTFSLTFFLRKREKTIGSNHHEKQDERPPKKQSILLQRSRKPRNPWHKLTQSVVSWFACTHCPQHTFHIRHNSVTVSPAADTSMSTLSVDVVIIGPFTTSVETNSTGII